MRLTRIMMTFAVAWLSTAAAQTTPTALFQQATLTGSNNTITATQIPVVTTSGTVVYLSATVQFNVDANGNLTISAGSPQITSAPMVINGSFKAGTYVGPSTVLSGKAIISVAGPGVGNGGYTTWTLTAGNGADPSTYPSSATWYVGPIANSPLAARVSKAGITSTMLYYGTASTQANNNTSTVGYQYWGGADSNALIGVSQVNNTITFSSFTKEGSDYSSPQNQITFTLTPNQ